MPELTNSNTLLGLFGPMLILAGLGLNIMLLWSCRHSLMGALLGQGFAPQIRFTAPPGEARPAATVLSFGRVRPVSCPLSASEPAVRLAA